MKARRTMTALAAGAAVGLAVALLGLLTQWLISDETLMRNGALYSWSSISLRRTAVAIEHYALEHHVPPSTLSLLEVNGFTPPFSREGRITDGWGHAFHYESLGTTYTLRSLGRDGLPGGVGLDADQVWGDPPLEVEELYPRTAPRATLHAFLFELPTRGMIQTCGLAGILAFVATFVSVFFRPIGVSSLGASLVSIILIIFASSIFCYLLAMAHVPSSH